MTILTTCDYCVRIRPCVLVKSICICADCQSKAQEAR